MASSIVFITTRLSGLLISLNWLLKRASGVAGSFFCAFPRIASTLRLLILGRRAVDISTLSEFQYSRLEGARGIRLLVLQPGCVSDEISCTLKIVSLDERPSFEALSYAWGDPAEKRPIQCGNGSLDVTINLYSALRHLRYMNRNRVLWADAVCINQNDLDERTDQVQLMGDIYSIASRTLIWLGEDTKEVEKSFASLKSIRKLLPSCSIFQFDPREDTSLLINKIHRNFIDRRDHVLSRNWDSVMNLLRRPWFRRKWVIQEVAKTKQALVVCGFRTLPWNLLEDICCYLKRAELLPIVMDPASADQNAFTALDNVIMIALVRQGGITRSLPHLLYTTRNFACRDPRDHIFALLGLARDVSPSDVELRPEYTTSASEIFQRYALWNLRRGSLEFLSSGFEPSSGVDGASPTWTPDFASANGEPGMPRSLLDFTAGAGSEGRIAISKDRRTITFTGKLIDEIGELGRVLMPTICELPNPSFSNSEVDNSDHSTSSYEGRVLSFIDWVRECKRISNGEGNSLAPERFEALWRTTMWDTASDGKRAPAELSTLFADYLHILENPLNGGDDGFWTKVLRASQAIEPALAAFSVGRRFCRTVGKRLGSMPKGAEVGDKICIFYGGELPYVIRPGDNGEYKFVGDCYLHGVMNGEANNIEGLQTEEFTLV
jgi:Heterokaryon incompatibility protein (HET)